MSRPSLDRSPRDITGWVVNWGGICLRINPRGLLCLVGAVTLLLVLAMLMLTRSALAGGPHDVISALFGVGEAPAIRSIQQRRAPRLLTAALVGGSLGVAGGVFQSISRNVLGSPDIIGFTAGAATGAIIQLTFFGGDVLATAISAVVGGAVTAVVVYALARRDGISGGYRLILVGIGIGAILSSVSSFLMVRASIDDAMSIQLWSAGSLTGRGWPHAWSVFCVVLLVLPGLLAMSQRLSQSELGDDVSGALGIKSERTRIQATLLAVILTGVATAATGPIAFIALAAPQIARRIVGRDQPQLTLAFVVGSLLLVGADLLAEALDIGLKTPVGSVTSLLGGLYLILILAKRL